MNTIKEPLISIITVSYNVVNSIEETILSVINQNFKDFEFIIIDGGSTDGTIDIIKKYQDKITFWVSEPDKGIYDAMNKGSKLAKGTYLFYLNAGDVIYDNVFTFVFKDRSNALNYDVLYGNIINSGTNTIVKTLPIKHIKYGMVFCHQAALVKKYAQDGFNFDTSYKIAADFNLFLKLYLSKKKFFDCNVCFGEYDNTGISNTMLFKTMSEYIKIICNNSKGLERVIEVIAYLNSKKKFITYLIIIKLIGDYRYRLIRSKFR